VNATRESLRAFASADVGDWAGLPDGLTLKAVAQILEVDVTDVRRGFVGDPAVGCDWVPAEGSIYSQGLQLWLDGPTVVAIEGIHPLDADGASIPAPDLGAPEDRCSTVLGPLHLEHGELIYAASGLAVRRNPANGLLLGLIGFVPTTAADYRSRLRPVHDPAREIPR
jgi:hypothetical protein